MYCVDCGNFFDDPNCKVGRCRKCNTAHEQEQEHRQALVAFVADQLQIIEDDSRILIDAVEQHRYDENLWLKDEMVRAVLGRAPVKISASMIFLGIIKFGG